MFKGAKESSTYKALWSCRSKLQLKKQFADFLSFKNHVPFCIGPIGMGVLLISWVLLYETVYLAESTDSYFRISYSGFFTGGPESIQNNFGVHFLITHVICKLYSLAPDVQWYGTFMICCAFIGVVNVSYLAKRLCWSISKSNSFLFSIICAIATILVLYEGVVLISMTYWSLILSISALLNTFVYVNSRSKEFKGFPVFFVSLQVAVFIIGMMIRTEPAALSILLATPLLLVLKSRSQVLSNFLFVSPFIGIVIASSILLNIVFSEKDANYIQFRPYQFFLWDFSDPNFRIEFANVQDSIIYSCSRDFFSADEKVFNAATFDRIGIQKMDKHPKYWRAYLANLNSKKFWHAVSFYQESFPYMRWKWALVVFFMLSISVFFLRIGWVSALTFALLISFELLTLVLISVFMKMETRLLTPFLFAVILITLVLYADVSANAKQGANHSILRFFFVIGVCVISVFNKEQVNIRMQYFENAALNGEYILSRIVQMNPDKTIVFDSGLLTTVYTRAFDTFHLPDYHKYVSIDSGLLYLYPSYKKHMKSVTGASTFENVAHNLFSDTVNTVFVTRQNRLDMICAYAYSLYGMELRYVPFPYPQDEALFFRPTGRSEYRDNQNLFEFDKNNDS